MLISLFYHISHPTYTHNPKKHLACTPNYQSFYFSDLFPKACIRAVCSHFLTYDF